MQFLQSTHENLDPKQQIDMHDNGHNEEKRKKSEDDQRAIAEEENEDDSPQK